MIVLTAKGTVRRRPAHCPTVPSMAVGRGSAVAVVSSGLLDQGWVKIYRKPTHARTRQSTCLTRRIGTGGHCLACDDIITVEELLEATTN